MPYSQKGDMVVKTVLQILKIQMNLKELIENDSCWGRNDSKLRKTRTGFLCFFPRRSLLIEQSLNILLIDQWKERTAYL